MMTLIHQQPYLAIFLTALLINIPFGYIRENAQKFSLSWFFWIHASIPIIIYMRLSLHTSPWFIPLAIAAAVVGQIVGGQIRKRRMTEADIQRYQRVSDLKLPVAQGQSVDDQKITVVLMNMGGPRDNKGVRDFLYRLFLDPIILRFPLSSILQPVFAWLIVTLRAKATEERYQLIGGGSPIYDSTDLQAKALQAELQQRGRNLDVTFCFNYSDPLPEKVLQEMKTKGKTHILPLSLYPHYSLATTGSNLHYIQQAAKAVFPQLQYFHARPYYLHPDYIRAFRDRVLEQIQEGESLDDFYLLFSTHGLPLYFLIEGDPYPYQISQSVSLVLRELNRQEAWSISYQSAVGPLEWLKPSTEDVLHQLSKRGVKKILVVPISFVTDHIETTCEINMEYKHVAQELGFTDFRMSKALECHPGFIKALADSVVHSLPGGSTRISHQNDGIRTENNQAEKITA